jgi:hypothetical protein
MTCFTCRFLRPYVDSGRVVPPPLPEIIEGEPEYVVEQILSHRDVGRGKRTKRQYLVKWEGYGEEHNSWEPVENLTHCDDAIQEYWSDQEANGADSPRRPKRRRIAK